MRELGGAGPWPCSSATAWSRDGNVPAERVRAVRRRPSRPRGLPVERIIEKPDEATLAALGSEVYVSMNCWRFEPADLRARAASIGRSPRGELELTDAVRLRDRDARASVSVVLPSTPPVLDLSSRGDIAAVAKRLEGMEVRL